MAGIAAALEHVDTGLVVVLAGDLPFADGLAPALLDILEQAPACEAAVPVDASGTRQPLAAAYRAAALRHAVRALEPVGGRPVRDLLALLRVIDVPARDLPPRALLDVDTPTDLAAARGTPDPDRLEAGMLQDWTAALSRDLGIELDVDADLLLELARDAAHAVSRPAAPVTTFLVGYAAALRGGGPEAIDEAADVARILAARWSAPEQA